LAPEAKKQRNSSRSTWVGAARWRPSALEVEWLLTGALPGRSGRPQPAAASVPPAQVDSPAQRPPLEEALEVLVEDRRDLGRVARPRDVRRDDDVGQLPERMGGSQGLLGEDVEHGSGDPSLAERPH